MPKNKLEKNISAFSKDCEYLGGYVYTTDNQLSSQLANNHITELTLGLTNFKDKSVIDIGCGDGTYTNELKKKSSLKSITGVEPSQAAITRARQKYKDISFRVGDIYSLKSRKYDIAVVRGVLHHLDNAPIAVKKICRSAKEIIIIEPNGYNPILKLIENLSPYHRAHAEKSYPPFLIDDWIKSANGTISKRKYAGLVPFFCPELFAKLLKIIEPIIERLPLVNAIICANYYVVYGTN